MLEWLVFCQEFFDGLKTLKKHTLKLSQLWSTRQVLVDGLLVITVDTGCIGSNCTQLKALIGLQQQLKFSC